MRESRKRKPRNAIRLFIGYEEDAEELVKKFVQMKKKYEFQNTVDLFSWLLQLGEEAGKPNNAKKPKISVSPKTEIQSPTTVVNKTSRRKQQNPLKANLLNLVSTDKTGHSGDGNSANGNNEILEEDNGHIVVETEDKEIKNYSNGYHDQEITMIASEYTRARVIHSP